MDKNVIESIDTQNAVLESNRSTAVEISDKENSDLEDFLKRNAERIEKFKRIEEAVEEEMEEIVKRREK